MPEGKVNLLYVDDEENNLISFRAAFRHSYNIFTATDADEAIKILHKERIPIIITDQRMPDTTGVQFLEQVIPEFPDSIRMILTGFSDTDVIIQAINTGRVFRYITKPWDEKELKITIDNAISMYNLHQSNKELMVNLDKRVRDQERMLSLFGRYVQPSIVEKLMESENENNLFEGDLRDIAVLFCDIRNFTAISSELPPKDVVELLNHFYTVMSGSVSEHNGFVIQYIGDEILAVFGAPLSHPQNHSNAVFCALDMVKKLKGINELFAARIGREIEVGIGVNAGEVVAGTMGSREKLMYSVIGDTVNTAKRIESLTQNQSNKIFISKTLFDRVGPHFVAKELEPVFVKGKKEALRVYEVQGRSNGQ